MAITTGTALLLSAAFGAAGAISQGQSAKKQADFQARVNEEQAARERLVSAQEERDFRKQQESILSQRRAAMGKSGVSQGTGSPLLAASDFSSEAELQALRIRSGGQTRSTRLEQQADLFRMGGKSAQRQGFARAGSSLLSGAIDAGAFGK